MSDQDILLVSSCECDVCGKDVVANLYGPAGHQLSDAERNKHQERVRSDHKSVCPGPVGRPEKHRVCASQREHGGEGDPKQ